MRKKNIPDGFVGTVRSVQIKILPTKEQLESEFNPLFDKCKDLLGFYLDRIQGAFEKFDEEIHYRDICSNCGKKTDLIGKSGSVTICRYCFKKIMAKSLISTGDRRLPPENDAKAQIEIPREVHYWDVYDQAFEMWSSYKAKEWERKQEVKRRRAKLLTDFAPFAKLRNNWFHRHKEAKMATCSICNRKCEINYFSSDKNECLCDNCFVTFKGIRREKKRLDNLKPISFPSAEGTAIRLKNDCVVHDDSIEMGLLTKKDGKTRVKIAGIEYLDEKGYMDKMKEQKQYANLVKQNGGIYLYYPLNWVTKEYSLTDDVMAAVIGLKKTGLLLFNPGGKLKNVEFVGMNGLWKTKNRYADLHSKMGQKNGCGVKLRQIRKLEDKERRFVKRYCHDFGRKIVDIITDWGRPKTLLIDYEGIRSVAHMYHKKKARNFSKWPVKMLQDSVDHKLTLEGIPHDLVRYADLDGLRCPNTSHNESKCNWKKGSILTNILAGINEFNCDKCGYENNLLVTLGRNMYDVYNNGGKNAG